MATEAENLFWIEHSFRLAEMSLKFGAKFSSKIVLIQLFSCLQRENWNLIHFFQLFFDKFSFLLTVKCDLSLD